VTPAQTEKITLQESVEKTKPRTHSMVFWLEKEQQAAEK